MSTMNFIYQTQAMNVLKKYLMDKNKVYHITTDFT
jgi:hypothetical protein